MAASKKKTQYTPGTGGGKATASMNLRGKASQGKVQVSEAGVSNIPGTVARAALTALRMAGKGGKAATSTTSTAGRGASIGGARSVNRPLTKAEKAQNKSAETYKTAGTRSDKQKAADAAASARMKKVQSKARTANRNTAIAGAAGATVGSQIEPKKTPGRKGAPAGRGAGLAAVSKKKTTKGK